MAALATEARATRRAWKRASSAGVGPWELGSAERGSLVEAAGQPHGCLMTRSLRKLDAATLRRLAVEASTDPRTIEAAYRGKPVRGLAGQRALAALRAAGLSDGARATKSTKAAKKEAQ